MHSSMLRPSRESSDTIILSPFTEVSRIFAIFLFFQEIFPDIFSSTNWTCPSTFVLASARIAALFFSMSWSMVDTRRYATVFGSFWEVFDEKVMYASYFNTNMLKISMVFLYVEGMKYTVVFTIILKLFLAILFVSI